MANQTTSPAEALVARAILAKLHPVPARGIETRAGLTRDAVLAAPDRSGPPLRAYRVRMPGGTWVLLDEDEVPWDLVRNQHLPAVEVD
jgi:hypothetical protein